MFTENPHEIVKKIRRVESILKPIAKILRCKVSELPERIDKLLRTIKYFKK